jgi:hypothetical protein
VTWEISASPTYIESDYKSFFGKAILTAGPRIVARTDDHACLEFAKGFLDID